ncbi:MAG: diguanylate cyclase [Pseudobdellovibrionaceae bacterium]
MKILIVDRDEVTTHLMKSRLEPLGHIIEIQAGRADMLESVMQEGWDVVFLDPSPLTNAKPLVTQIRRASRRPVFVVLLAKEGDSVAAVADGFNDLLLKPLAPNSAENVVAQAEHLNSLMRHLANDQEDYPSAGGVIAKSAFNQLFLSCMDRADRYGESAHIIFIAFDNYKEVAANDGENESEIISAKLAQKLVRYRRQSDIIAQIRKNEYALLLLRPLTDSEPLDASYRFAETLSKCTDLPTNPIMDVVLRVMLVALPTGKVNYDFSLTVRQF